MGVWCCIGLWCWGCGMSMRGRSWRMRRRRGRWNGGLGEEGSLIMVNSNKEGCWLRVVRGWCLRRSLGGWRGCLVGGGGSLCLRRRWGCWFRGGWDMMGWVMGLCIKNMKDGIWWKGGLMGWIKLGFVVCYIWRYGWSLKCVLVYWFECNIYWDWFWIWYWYM